MALKQNVIYIYFKGKHLVTSKSQYQYNHGQFLYFADLDLPQTFEVHFSNTDEGYAKPQIGSNRLVEIPDAYFWTKSSQIYAWIYLHEGATDGETKYEVIINLERRSEPVYEEILPTQQTTIERAISELNNAVDVTTENANKTGEDRAQVSNIKDEIVDLKEDIDANAELATEKAQEAVNASLRSEASAQNAAEYESNALFKPMIRLASVTDSAYAPYENICPISGWTGCEVNATGINIWDEEWEVGTYSTTTGDKATASNMIRSTNLIPVVPGVTYRISGTFSLGSYNGNLLYYDKDKTFVSSNYWGGSAHSTKTIPDGVYYIAFSVRNEYGTSYNNDIYVNYPSTDHDYHHYTGRSITISWADEAGTVYGGKLDVLSGVLRVERKCIDLSNIEFIRDSAGYFQSRANATIINDGKHFASGEIASLISSQYIVKAVASVQNNNGSCGMYWYASDNRNILRIRDDRYSDAQSFMSAMVGVQLCYELAEPIEIQLTPQQVNSLYGVNNIWADTGDTEVEYRADMQRYIDKKISEAIASITQNGTDNVTG